MRSSPDQIKRETNKRITEVFKWDSAWSDKEALPGDDPHIKEFLGISDENKFLQGRVGYCFQPLISDIAEALKDKLAFIILMYSPSQLEPSVPMGKLPFCAFNNCDPSPESQLRFRKIFRFVGTDRFSLAGIQTSKILFEKPSASNSKRHSVSYIYSFEEGEEPTVSPDETQMIPVGPLLEGVLDSFYFQNLKSYLNDALPENIREELGKQFERFHKDGDLEKYVIARRREQSETPQSVAVVKHIDQRSLRAFEHLLTTFDLRSSTDLRRRFLNYLTWMLLCDENIQSYGYMAALTENLPQAEFVIASRELADKSLLAQTKEIAVGAFELMLSHERSRRNRTNADRAQPAGANVEVKAHFTLHEERADIIEFINSKEGRMPNNNDKANAILEMDDALLNYVTPILTNTFLTHSRNLSLDPFWGEKPESTDSFKPYIADLNLAALKEEFDLYKRSANALQSILSSRLPGGAKQAISRVNPFLMPVSPVAEYLAKEMTSVRKAVVDQRGPTSLGNRRLGETPLDASGLLSLNVVFWDIATKQFRYCSVSFINSDQVFDYAFNRFFRLIDTLDVPVNGNKPGGRGILGSVLLMSDVLFRKSKRDIEPVCIVFQDPEPNTSKRFAQLSVASYISYLTKEPVRAAFNKVYREILLGTDKRSYQAKFNEFCSNQEGGYGVWDFINRADSEELKRATEKFLKRHGVKSSDSEDLLAKFLSYVTWLWLCYRERLAYYYYIPAQLPFNERVGGFAIATEAPIPEHILDFLSVSIAPRVVAHPTLLHHRGVVTKASRTIEQCWFDSLLHLIYNGYGIQFLKKNLQSIILKLAQIRQTADGPLCEDLEKIQAKLERAQQQMEQITTLERDLQRMLDHHLDPNMKFVSPEWVFSLCQSLSSIFAQNRGVSIILDWNPQAYGDVQIHSPLLLILWHVVLNACQYADELSPGPTNDRRVRIRTALERENQLIKISVENFALLSTAMRLEEPDDLGGLLRDRETLGVLWDDTLGAVRPEEVLDAVVHSEGGGKAKVEVNIYAPAVFT